MSAVTVYPTLAARHAAVALARERRAAAWAVAATALDTGEHAAAREAMEGFRRADSEYRRVLTEEWRVPNETAEGASE